MEDTFGPISETPLAFYDHDTSYWRMSQGTLAWVPPQSLEILPASGMTQNGRLYERLLLEHHTNANDGFVSLPTPTAEAAKHGATQDVTANSHGKNLWDIPYLLPTPTARDWKDSGKAVINSDRNLLPQKVARSDKEKWVKGGGSLNPTWVEWLMGYPSGWTDLSPSETVSSHTSPTISDNQSSKPTMWRTPTQQDSRIGPNNKGGYQHRKKRGSTALADQVLFEHKDDSKR